MAKYIDAELLRKEIKRRIEILKKAEIDWAKQGDTETSVYFSGKAVALDEFTDFIDSLQQEQPEVDLEKVVMIDNVIMNMTAEGYNIGYKTRQFYEEVLRRLNARKEEQK